MGLSCIDAIIYINLEHRKDRQLRLLQELTSIEIDSQKIFRVDAVHDILNGHRGCAQSHIKALELAQEKNFSNVLILEDDAMFIKDRRMLNHILERFFCEFYKKWDVFFLGAAVFDVLPTHVDSFKQVLCAECAHSYVVSSNYYTTLMRCFSEALHLMHEDEDFSDSTFKALDQKWKHLQQKDRWFIGPIMTQQRRSYSDIDHLIKDRAHQEYY